MNGTNLFMVGEINFIKKTEFEGAVSHKIQFITEDETKGISLIEVKLLEEQDLTILKRGTKVQIPISISTMNSKIYYKQNGKLSVK